MPRFLNSAIRARDRAAARFHPLHRIRDRPAYGYFRHVSLVKAMPMFRCLRKGAPEGGPRAAVADDFQAGLP